MSTLDNLAAELLAADQSRPRSLQVAPGASQAGSCRAALLLRTTDTPPTNVHLGLATLWGTAIHQTCEQAASDGVMVEQAFTYRGVRATIDRYDPATRTLTDLKTKATPEAVAKIGQVGPSRQQRWQIHLGAAALCEAGYPVETVELLFLPRSGGTVDDCWLWSEPFSRETADEAADWMQAEADRAAALDGPVTAADLDGLRDEPFFWCRDFCDWFTLCRGDDAQPSDEAYADAAYRFWQAKRTVEIATTDKRIAAADLAGFAGRAGGLEVRQVAGSSSYVLDTDAIKEKAELWSLVTGEPLPTKESRRQGYVSVVKAKGAA